jgi:endonuclease III related protein
MKPKPVVGREQTELLLKVYDRLYSRFGPQGWWPVNGRYNHPGPLNGRDAFEIMVGAILTQNTSWTNVEKALVNLRTAGCLTLKALLKVPRRKLARYLKPSGYFNVKAERLKRFVRFLYRQYGGDLGKMLREEPGILRRNLLSVKGIGPETADSILLYAAGRPWFVVDAYTRRIFSRHGLASPQASYEDLQDFFMCALPREPKLYNEYHALIVRLGKEDCKPRPVCDRCPVLEVLGEPVLTSVIPK